MDATREEKLKSAKAKLKQYRAKQAKQQSRSSIETCSTTQESPKRASFHHAHRRSLSRRHSRSDSILSKRQSITLTSPSPVLPPSEPPQRHARRASRHSRQLSIGTRKESMDIMSGLIASGSLISNPLFLQAGGSPDLLNNPDALSPAPSVPFSSPKTPHSGYLEDSQRRDTYRMDALEALEGRSPPRALGLQDLQESPSHTPLINKRASWGSSAASAMALQGGKGALDLGMLVEEEEEEEDACSTANASLTARPSPTPSSVSPPKVAPTRRRPESLRLSSQSSLGTAVNALSPLDLNSFTPETATTTPGSSGSFGNYRMPLKSLSLSTGASAAPDAFHSVAIPLRTTKPTHRTSGLKSLTLSTSPLLETTGLPPITPQRRRSSVQGLSLSSAGSSASKRRTNGSFGASGSTAPAGNRRMSYRSFGTPDETMFGRLVMDDESVDDSRSEASHGYSDNSFRGDNSFQFQSSSEVNSLKIQIEALQSEAATLRSELSASKFQISQLQAETAQGDKRIGDETRALHYRLFEIEGQLEAKKAELAAEQEARKLDVERLQVELADFRERFADVECERDGLREDVDGWRTRCGSLEKAVQAERTAKEEERKQSMIAREKVRKLGDQLAALSSGDRPAQQADAALVTAQAKLIGEMRDQIFAMAAALEHEKKQVETQSTLAQQLRQQLFAQEQASAMQAHQMQNRTHTDSDVSASSRGYSKSTSLTSLATEATDDTSYSSDIVASSPLTKPNLGLSINLGSLNVVQEEDEENTSVSDLEPNAVLEESDWVDDGDDVPELDFRGTQTHAQSRQSTNKLGSTSSSVVDEPLPATPCRYSPEPSSVAAQASATEKHNRSHSFIKQWTFPKGTVEPVHIFEPDDHSFFAISSAQILPPLPVSDDALVLPEFFTSDLVFDEEIVRKSMEVQQPPKHVRRPSSPRPTSQRFSPIRSSFSSSTGGPPPARSSRLSAAMSETSQGSFSSALTKTPSRMSLQGISSLISAYVAPTQTAATVMPKMAYAAAGLCHTREESIFADDDRALLRPLSVISPIASKTANQRLQQEQPRQSTPAKPRPISKAEQPRPFASPLRLLDFIASFGLQPEQVLRV